MGRCFARPKIGGDPEFARFVDQDHEVVAEHLRQRLVLLCRIGLGAERVAEFPLDHTEGRLDVAALVVVREKFLAPVHEVPVHLGPRAEAFRLACYAADFFFFG